MKKLDLLELKVLERRFRTTIAYVLCIVIFPFFNILFKSIKLFLYESDSLIDLGLEIDQTKALFEDSPQLSLQLFIVFKDDEPFPIQILAIIMSTLCVAVPNTRCFMDKIDKQRTKNWRYYLKLFGYFFIFVLVAFSRAASIAIICCFFSYNAILLYITTFVGIKVIMDIANIVFVHSKTLKLILRETQADIIANSFNIRDVTKHKRVIRLYAFFWMNFNVAALVTILLLTTTNNHTTAVQNITKSLQNQTATMPNITEDVHLWISPSIILTNWLDIFIVKQNCHREIIMSLCFLNIISCVLIALFIKPNYEKPPSDISKEILKTKVIANPPEAISEKEARKIWKPYKDSNHFDCAIRERKGKLSTMALLEDPWIFVDDYISKIPDSSQYSLNQIRHSMFTDPKELLLKIMMISHPVTESNPVVREIFSRCRTHYEFLVSLEQEQRSKANLEASISSDKIPDVTFADKEVQVQEDILSSTTVAKVAPDPVRDDSVSEVLAVMKMIALHMRCVGLGLRDIQRSLRMIDSVEEDSDFKIVFRVVQNQMKHYGIEMIPQVEKVVGYVGKLFDEHIIYTVTYYEEDKIIMSKAINDMKKDVIQFKENVTKLENTQQDLTRELVNMEFTIIESLEKFKEVTESYKNYVNDLEAECKMKTFLDTVLEKWSLITKILSVNEEPMKHHEPQNKDIDTEIRVAIAIKTKAIIIPSMKKYISSLSQLPNFYDSILEDLEEISNVEESDALNYFKNMNSRSDEVKEACSQFMSEMSKVRTDLSVAL